MTTSSKKSKSAQPNKVSVKTQAHGFEGLPSDISTPGDIKAYEQIAELQQDLAREKDKRLEERFYYGAGSSLLVFCMISSSIAAPLWAIVIPLYLGALTIAAQKCGVDDVVVILNTIYSKWSKKHVKDEN